MIPTVNPLTVDPLTVDLPTVDLPTVDLGALIHLPLILTTLTVDLGALMPGDRVREALLGKGELLR